MRAVIVAVCVAACGGSQNIDAARNATYNADRAVVYREALAATQELYDEANGDERDGTIATAWHQVDMSGAQWDPGTSSIDQGTAVARRGQAPMSHRRLATTPHGSSPRRTA